MQLKPHPYRSTTATLPDFLMPHISKALKCEECTKECDDYIKNDCISDEVNYQIDWLIENCRDKVTTEEFVRFSLLWQLAAKFGVGEPKMNVFDLSIEDDLYRITWASWARELMGSSNGVMLCYKVTDIDNDTLKEFIIKYHKKYNEDWYLGHGDNVTRQKMSDKVFDILLREKEETLDVLDEDTALSLIEKYQAESGKGTYKFNWIDVTVNDQSYRVIWFGRPEDVIKGKIIDTIFDGHMLCYEISK